MKPITAAALALAVSACSTVSHSPPSYYRAAGDTEQIVIGGSIDQSAALTANGYSHEITITINGETVISADMGGASAQDYSADWKGRKVSATCLVIASDRLFNRRPGARCLVFINGERAGTVAL